MTYSFQCSGCGAVKAGTDPNIFYVLHRFSAFQADHEICMLTATTKLTISEADALVPKPEGIISFS